MENVFRQYRNFRYNNKRRIKTLKEFSDFGSVQQEARAASIKRMIKAIKHERFFTWGNLKYFLFNKGEMPPASMEYRAAKAIADGAYISIYDDDDYVHDYLLRAIDGYNKVFVNNSIDKYEHAINTAVSFSDYFDPLSKIPANSVKEKEDKEKKEDKKKKEDKEKNSQVPLIQVAFNKLTELSWENYKDELYQSYMQSGENNHAQINSPRSSDNYELRSQASSSGYDADQSDIGQWSGANNTTNSQTLINTTAGRSFNFEQSNDSNDYSNVSNAMSHRRPISLRQGNNSQLVHGQTKFN